MSNLPNPSKAQNDSGQSITSFPLNAVKLVPSDVDQLVPPVAVYVGVAGDVAVVPANGKLPVLFSGLQPGDMVPVLVSMVCKTGTTATNLVGCY
jgi:hypothetical protein